MVFGMLASAALAAFALLVALDRIGQPIDGQVRTNYGWSGVIIGVALFGFFAYLLRGRSGRQGTAA